LKKLLKIKTLSLKDSVFISKLFRSLRQKEPNGKTTFWQTVYKGQKATLLHIAKFMTKKASNFYYMQAMMGEIDLYR
jgi:hypothetical protein